MPQPSPRHHFVSFAFAMLLALVATYGTTADSHSQSGEGAQAARPLYGQLNAEYFRRLEEAALEGYLINPGKGGGSQGSDALLRDYVIAACRAAGRRYIAQENVHKHGLRLLEAAKQNGNPPGLLILGIYLATFSNIREECYNSETLELLPEPEAVETQPALLRNICHLLRSFVNEDEKRSEHITAYCAGMLAEQQDGDDPALLLRLCLHLRNHPDCTIFAGCAESLLPQERWRWLGLHLQGLMFAKHAWNARGTGWAKDIPAEDWADMREYSALSDKALEESYRLRPDLPYTALEIINSLSDSLKVEDRHQWFDRAITAIPDLPTTHSTYRWRALEPRWDGSNARRENYARACFSGAYSPFAAVYGLYPLARLYTDGVTNRYLSAPDWRIMWRNTDYEAQLRESLLRLICADMHEHDKRLVSALLGIAALWQGELKLAKTHLLPLVELDVEDFSDLEIDIGRALTFTSKSACLRGALDELHALSGKYGQRIIDGEKALFAWDTEHGLNIWKQIIAEATEDDIRTRDHLRERAALHMLRGGLGKADRAFYNPAIVNAAKAKDTATIKWLLANGASMSQQDILSGKSPPASAHPDNQPEPISAPPGPDDDLNEMLYTACAKGYPQFVEWLIQNGADIKATRKNGWHPLLRAAASDSYYAAELLLKHGANPNIPSNTGRTPIYYASLHLNAPMTRLLVAHGADINCTEEEGWRPLALAISENATELVELLVQLGADVNIKNNYDNPPMYAAIRNNCPGIIRILAKYGADINMRGGLGLALITTGVRNNSVAAVNTLIELGADINAATPDHESPLYAACLKGNVEMAKLLIEHGACIDRYIYKNTWSELMAATAKGHSPVVQLLLKHGADPERKIGKYSPLSVVKKGDERTIIILREAIARRKAAAAAANKPVDKNLAEEEAE